jgi:epoxide hydrolase-like predicted phosphatase
VDGLLIDWGGVLTHSVLASFAAFGEREGLPRDAVGAALGDGLLAALEDGTLALPDFERRLGERLGVEPTKLAERLMRVAGPDQQMRAAVRRFHDAGILTALVSNSWRRTDYDMDDAFDAVVLSQDLGIRKPDPRIYAEALKRLDLAPDRCVFVDDLGGNLKPAKQLRMTTVKHERAETTIPQLERLLFVSAS